MKYKLGFFTETNADFAEMKKEGFGGVIFPPQLLTAEIADKARKGGLNRFLYIGDLTKNSCNYIGNDGIKKGEIGFVSAFLAEKTAKESKAATIAGCACPLKLKVK